MTQTDLNSNSSQEEKIVAGKPSTTKTHHLSKNAHRYIDEHLEGVHYEQQPVVTPLEVDEFASKIAKMYEKVRRIIDWKEENIIRRTAIERILKRTLLSELSGLGQSSLDAAKLTEPLVLEMMRSGYFAPGKVSKNKIPQAKNSLAKYIYILNHSPLAQKNNSLRIKERVNFFNWILEIAACEIEEILEPAFKENALINFMTTTLYRRTRVIPHGKMTDEEVLVQIYIAVHRSLYSLDEPIIIYNLLKYYYPQWFEDNPQFIDDFSHNIQDIKIKMEADLEHKFGKEFFKLCDRYDAAFLILGDVMKEVETEIDVKDKLSQKPKLYELIETVYNRRRSTLKQRLYRSAIYSTLSIFVAGIVSFVVFEGPVAKLVGDGFSWFALFIDLAVPSALMFLLVITIKPPGEKNLIRVKEEVLKMMCSIADNEIYEVQLERKKNFLVSAIFSLISLVGGAVGAYGVFMIFKIAGVPWTSIYVDTINVAMVVFAAMVIRHRAQELTIQEEGGIMTMLLDFFYLPLARLGQWFSQKWKEYNIVSVFFSALIDSPFSMLIGLIEDWRSFLRDRRSEIH